VSEETRIFSPVGEKEIARAIVSEFAHTFDEYAESDCIVVGAGPSGLVLALYVARKGHKVLVLERNNSLGGGFWGGGYLMNKLTVRAPGNELLDEIGCPNREISEGLYVADAPHACAKLMGAACDAGAAIFNMTSCKDVVLRDDNRVAGVVINWAAVDSLPRELAALDPVAIETKVVVDGTGHEAVVATKLEQRGLIRMKGEGAMWVERSEDLIVHNTSEIHPGLVVIGMAVAPVFGVPRMGPTFGGMFLSGKRGAEIVESIIAG